MNYELEMKAHLSDLPGVEALLRAKGLFLRDFDKSDAYFLLPGSQPGQGRSFRIRQDGGQAVVTWKERGGEGGFETNKEHEFQVSDTQAFLALARQMGAQDYFCKRKIGRAYQLGLLTVELAEVPPLGFFAEIERVIDGQDGAPGVAELEAVKSQILSLIDELKIPRTAIEERYYSEMLREARAGSA